MMIYIVFLVVFLIFSLRYNWWRVPVSYDKARVLMYHSISEHKNEKFDKWRVEPREFEKQLKWLKKNGFTSYTISELANMDIVQQKSVCITFDDGFMDNFTNAYDLLKKYGFKATIYLVPNQKTNHWENKNTKYISNMLGGDEILSMSDIIEFGSHTMSHVNLSRISTSELEFELKNSKELIEQITKKECTAFAYPYGKFSDEAVFICKKVGYKNATIVKRGVFGNGDDKFMIRRIGVLGTESFFDFWLKFTRVRNKI